MSEVSATKGIDIGGETKIRRLNGNQVVVSMPKKELSFEEGIKEIRKRVESLKKR